MERISVIIPTYNRADLLIESIKAIQAQSYPVHEIIVIDDGSTDATRAALSSLSGAIQYVYQPNAGKAAALNSGLGRCTGDYIWICDDDDLALPRAAELLVTALKINGSAGFAFGRYKRFAIDPKTDKKLLFEPVYWPDLDSTSILVSLLMDCFIFQNACLVRRKALDAVGPFRVDLLRSQDYEMTVRLARRFESIYVPDVVFLQRAHQGVRGTAADRFDSSKQMEKWLTYDAMFFRDLYDEIPLADFVPKLSQGVAADILERAALLQRACIFWRRKFFDISLDDMAEAIRMGEGKRLTAIEETICGGFLHPKFDCEELVTRQDIANALLSLASRNEFGHLVVKAVTAWLMWYVRRSLMQRRWHECRSYTKLLLKLHGYTGLAVLAKISILRRFKLG